jgi:hypothetical protein
MRRLREAIAPNKFDLIHTLQKQIIARLYHLRKCASDQSTNKRLGFRHKFRESTLGELTDHL